MFKSGLRLRKQLLIDHRVQLPILQRMGFHMLACALYFMVVLFCAESTSYGHESLSRTLMLWVDVMVCWAPGIMLLAPIIAYDVLLFTNKFAGPMYRLRREMQGLIDGNSETPIKLRSDDCWPEMADLFNEIQAELIELRAAAAPKTKVLFDPTNADSGDMLIREDTAEQEQVPEQPNAETQDAEMQHSDQQDAEELAVEEQDVEAEDSQAQDADRPSGEEQLATA